MITASRMMGERSKAGRVRAALMGGPRPREQIHAEVLSVHRNAVNSAILDMANSGAIESDGDTYRLHHSIHSEDDYRKFMREARYRRRADAPAKTDRQDVARGAVVDAALRAWR